MSLKDDRVRRGYFTHFHSNLQSAQVFEVEQPEDLECVAQGRVGRPQLGRDAHAVLREVHGLALRLRRRLVGLGRGRDDSRL